ncbi:FAD-binding oxidoreductase [Nordella sp. HKS 07]|uniref:FAD-dependent oxidoreductase n=1 Tax=Nordella sp. HKS 07 TaxID=2712222 RepID=UPI0013E18728|nr:FAD-dependent oxidoreductase [Nordella sp. HKS 07]QIG46640.1 FAD-binding oxidoreductase [Nordella sp. HKS 07]
MRAIVIGAGVVGTSVAYHLAKKGVDVTILEQDYVGAGTSGATFAWTNANRKPPQMVERHHFPESGPVHSDGSDCRDADLHAADTHDIEPPGACAGRPHKAGQPGALRKRL